MVLNPQQLTIINYPNKVLRAKAKPVSKITAEVKAVAVKMLELMHQAPGVGLAAPQVGLSWRLFVACPTGQAEDDRVFINPVLTRPSRTLSEREEGCLSLPGITGLVRRPKTITVTATDLEGQEFTLTSDDLPACVWQHETDHLDGVLILDRMDKADRLANQKLLRDLERGIVADRARSFNP